MPEHDAPPGPRQRWLARGALALAVVSLLLLVRASVVSGVHVLLLTVLAAVVGAAATFWFLAHRGLVRALAAALLVLIPLALVWLFVAEGLVLDLIVVLAVAVLAGVVGRAALDRHTQPNPMPELVVPPPQHPFLVMNPRSGGGKVARFGLKEKAEELGAEVALLEGPEQIDVRALAEDAVARGADLLGVAGGDGTQALVAGVAAEHDVPFLVIPAGTRNHFALDLGLDREDVAASLAALTDDAVELCVDLGMIGDRTFVNNASFGAYAAVVQSPAYRDDKTRTTLTILPDLLTEHGDGGLAAHAEGLEVDHPQAVLVSDNPYGTGDVAGMGRRARLDSGTLGLVTLSAANTVQAVGLLRGASSHGLNALAVPEVVVTADAPQIPVGVDGEALMLPTPVHCTIRHRALRVRVPRVRPGVPARRESLSWVALRRLAGRGGHR